jgi:HEAT repeat protein
VRLALRKLGEAPGAEAVAGRIARGLKAPRWQDRVRAAEALGALRNKAAAKPLIAAMADPEPNVRAAAAEAMGRLADRSALSALTAALNDPDPYVRRAAFIAAADIRRDSPPDSGGESTTGVGLPHD